MKHLLRNCFLRHRNIYKLSLENHLKTISRRFQTGTIEIEAEELAPKFASSVGGAGVKIFDRNLKMKQRDRAAENFGDFAFMKSEVAYQVADRIYDIKRFFDVAVDLGCATGLLAPQIFKVSGELNTYLDFSTGKFSNQH